MQKSYIKLWKCNFVLMNAIRIADDMNVCVCMCVLCSYFCSGQITMMKFWKIIFIYIGFFIASSDRYF